MFIPNVGPAAGTLKRGLLTAIVGQNHSDVDSTRTAHIARREHKYTGKSFKDTLYSIKKHITPGKFYRRNKQSISFSRKVAQNSIILL